MKRSHFSTLFGLVLLAGWPFLVSCTIVIKPRARTTQYATAEKIRLKIALNLTDELRDAKWEQRAILTPTIMPVGPALTEDASRLASNTFIEVVEIKNGSPPPKPVDAILTPKMAFVGMASGQIMPFAHDTTTIRLEWTLADPMGKVLWADTVTGLGESNNGLAKNLTLALEDVFKKSQDTMLSSKVIQQFAAKKWTNVRQ